MYNMVTLFPANSCLCLGDLEITGGLTHEGQAEKPHVSPLSTIVPAGMFTSSKDKIQAQAV
jgi:hypothetical protein